MTHTCIHTYIHVSYANISPPISKSRILELPEHENHQENFFKNYSLSRCTKSEPSICDLGK